MTACQLFRSTDNPYEEFGGFDREAPFYPEEEYFEPEEEYSEPEEIKKPDYLEDQEIFIGEGSTDEEFYDEKPEETPITPVKVKKKKRRYVKKKWKNLYLYKGCRVRVRASRRSKTIKVQRAGVWLRVKPFNKRWLKSRSGYMNEKCFRK